MPDEIRYSRKLINESDMPDEVRYKRKFINTSMSMGSMDFDEITIVTNVNPLLHFREHKSFLLFFFF